MKNAPWWAETRGVSSDMMSRRHGLEVLLPLHHAREPGEVGLQPVLLGVLLGRLLQVDDHLVDVVFERGDLALRFDGDRSRQSPLVTAVATSEIARTCEVRLPAS